MNLSSQNFAGAGVASKRWSKVRPYTKAENVVCSNEMTGDLPITRLHLIRHAATDASWRLCGSLDISLSSRGRLQVLALAHRLAVRHPPAALYTSTAMRAREVAAALESAWGLEAQLTDAAREIDCGRFEGMPLDELRERFPDLWARNLAQADETFAWPGGESYRAFRTRVLAGLQEIASRHRGQRVAIVTHAGVISQVLGTIRGRTPAAWEPDRPDPLTGTEVIWANGSPQAVLTYNDPDWY